MKIFDLNVIVGLIGKWRAKRLVAIMQFTLMCSVFATVCQADIVHLKNGRRIEGKVTKETGEVIVIKIAGGEITIKKSTIQRIEPKEFDISEPVKETVRKDVSRAPKIRPIGFKSYLPYKETEPRNVPKVERKYQEAIDALGDTDPKVGETAFNKLLTVRDEWLISDLIDNLVNKNANIKKSSLFLLNKLTGYDFGYDQNKWRHWFRAAKNIFLEEDKNSLFVFTRRASLINRWLLGSSQGSRRVARETADTVRLQKIEFGNKWKKTKQGK